MHDFLTALGAPVPAFPLDLFRVLAGGLAFEYFRRAFVTTPEFSSPDGLIDHTLCQRLFPPTRLSLFQAGMPACIFRWLFGLACAASCLVVLGYHPRSAAAFLFVVAVSTYRWNILVAYVDDAIMHLVLFWLILLPVGETIGVGPWLATGSPGSLAAWSTATVPGASVRLFLANLALIYVTSGLYKFTSPLWRSGMALPVVLKLPVSRAPDFWRPRHHLMLRGSSYGVLIMEPVFALMFVLPAHSGFKWSLVVLAGAFHLGIVATLRIPFANFAMVGALPIVLGPEIMELGFGTRPGGAAAGSLSPAALVALLLVTSLTLMVVWEAVRTGRLSNVPLWKDHLSVNPIFAALWAVGIAQSYRLFDWIDERNYHVRYEVFLSGNGDTHPRWEVPPDRVFPGSLRHLLLQSYVFGNIWMQMDADKRQCLAPTILARYARRYARNNQGAGRVEVFSVLQRVTPDNFDLRQGQRTLLLRFAFSDGESRVEYAHPTG